MAVIDPVSDTVVIRIVYDGAPFAGKTTTIRALAGGFGGQVRSPGEIEGRTLFFDWLDYTAGLFEGRRIRCQIVSVPGQAILAPRRRRLLLSADVVVYVSDGSPSAFAAELGYLVGLKQALESRATPPVGVVVQANKRDLPDAVPVADLRNALDRVRLKAAIIESNACDGTGVRETFVFAVRLALDRVRELLRNGKLREARPQVDNDDDLLADLKRHDVALAALEHSTRLPHTRLSDLAGKPASTERAAATVAANVADTHHVAAGAEPDGFAGVAGASAAAPAQSAPAHSAPAQSASAHSAGPPSAAAHPPSAQSAPTHSLPAHSAPALAPPAPSLAALALAEVIAESRDGAYSAHDRSGGRPRARPEDLRPPRLPDTRVASGLIWPVVIGRTVLSELTDRRCPLRRLPNGDWEGICDDRWRLFSFANSRFSDLEQGRRLLLRWARSHVTLAGAISNDRCIALSADHGHTSRLWQVVRVELSLQHLLQQSLALPAREFAEISIVAILALDDIQNQLAREGVNARVSLAEIGLHEMHAQFIGNLPLPSAVDTSPATERGGLAATLRVAAAALRSRRDELLEVLKAPFRVQPRPAVGPASPVHAYLRQSAPDEVERSSRRLYAYLAEL